jgi:hypothetical protein
MGIEVFARIVCPARKAMSTTARVGNGDRCGAGSPPTSAAVNSVPEMRMCACAAACSSWFSFMAW